MGSNVHLLPDQTVENKQKFISQIMTSKSPVRSCDDVDETALSFAEIKALCAGDPRIKERMDLDVEVSKLKLMKADHQSKQYRLEDQLLKYFPEEIEKHKGFIQGFEADLETLAAHPHPEDGFAGMEIRGDTLTDKENAGAALLDACKEVKNSEPVQIGSYRGFAMSVTFDAWRQEYTLLLKGQMTHRASLGIDPRGNLTRIDNALSQMPQRLEATKAQLDNLYQQQAAAKEEVGKPFPYEDDLRVKSARLVELDTLLNLDGRSRSQPESVIAKSARPSVLDSLKRPVPPRCPEKKPKQHEEVRYSRRNKEWAKTIPNYNSDSVRGGYAVNSHPAVLNGFIDLVREEQQRSCTKDEKAEPPRTSVREKLKKETPVVNRSTVPKKGEPER